MTKEFCRHCGAEAPEGAQNCAICGSRLSAFPDAAPDIHDALTLETAQREAFTYATAGASPPPPPNADPTPSDTAQPDTAQPLTHYGPYPTYPTATGVWAPPAQPVYSPYASYPAAPHGASAPAAPNGQPATSGGYGGYGSYGYPWPPYGPYYAPLPQPPRRAPGETYALVISWIVTVASGLAILGGLLVTALASLGVFTGQSDDLSFLGSIIGFSLAPVVGGAFGVWYGIQGIRRRPSPRFTLPAAWQMLALTVLAIGGGVALWQFNFTQSRAPGTAFGVLPLATLAGALPALAILAFTTQRLRNPSTRRHVWMSLFYGMSLAPLLAIILETIASFIIIAAFHLTGQDAQSVLGQPNTGNPSPTLLTAMLLMLSVVAPLVEEGMKPLAALLVIRRLRTPAEAFLVGLAAGVGFDMLETIGYIGQGQADWVSVAIDRIGAGLLHGLGAGMGALAWYYLINGAGVRYRWLRAIGCGAYAIAQHAIFNALSFSDRILPSNVGQWLQAPFFLGGLPMQRADIIYLVAYALIFGMLIFMTGRLLRARGMPERKPPATPTPTWPMWQATPYGYYAPYTPQMPYAPYGQYGQYGHVTPGGWPAPAPIPQLQQPMGGAQ